MWSFDTSPLSNVQNESLKFEGKLLKLLYGM
jgi:hypothetical protein